MFYYIKIILLSPYLPALHKFQILVFMHKYVYQRSKLPTVFSSYIEENKLFHNYNTRQKNNFHTYIVHSEIGKRNVKYKGSTLWNNLPTEIKNTASPKLFKIKLKKYLLQSLDE